MSHHSCDHKWWVCNTMETCMTMVVFWTFIWITRLMTYCNESFVSTGRYDLSLPLVTCKSCFKSWTPGFKDLQSNGYWPGNVDFQTVYSTDVFHTFEEFKVSAPGLSRQAFVKMLVDRTSNFGRVNGVTPSTSAVPILDCCINNIIKHVFILFKCNRQEEYLEIVSSVVSWSGPTADMRRKNCWLLTISLVQPAWKTLQQFLLMETARCTASIGLKGMATAFI